MTRASRIGLAVICVCVLWPAQRAESAGHTTDNYCKIAGASTLFFDGIDDYVNLGNGNSLRLTENLTLCAWVQLVPRAAGRTMGIAGKLSDWDGFGLMWHGDRFKFLMASDSNMEALQSGAVTEDTEWHHLAGVLSGDNAFFYLDGRLQGQTFGVTVSDSGEYASVGRLYSNILGNFFRGLVDEVRVYDRPLSAGEIEALAAGFSPGGTGLRGHWDFNESDGQYVYDQSGHNSRGYLGQSVANDASDPQWIEMGQSCGSYIPSGGGGGSSYCKVAGQALYFDGENDFVNLGQLENLEIHRDFTLACWVKLDPSHVGRIMGILGKAQAHGYTLRKGHTHYEDHFAFALSTKRTFFICVSNEPYTDTEWHHIAGTYGGASATLYVDGTPADSTFASFDDSGQYAFVGKVASDIDVGFFRGLIDDVRIHNTALSPQDIAKLASGESPVNPGRTSHWPFKEGGGQIVDDVISQNDGYLGRSVNADGADPKWRVTGTNCGGTSGDATLSLSFDTPSDMQYVTDPVNASRVLRAEDPQGALLLWNTQAGPYVPVTRAGALIPFSGEYDVCPVIRSIRLDIEFDYLFRSATGALAVSVLQGDQVIQTAGLVSPPEGQAGGVGSLDWGTYAGTVAFASDLTADNFFLQIRLELIGPQGTQIMINDLKLEADLFCEASAGGVITISIKSSNFPVYCNSYCGDVVTAVGYDDYTFGPDDYIATLSSCGTLVDNDNWCLESPFADDGFVSLSDALFISWANAEPSMIDCANREGRRLGDMGGRLGFWPAGGCVWDSSLVIAGKAYSNRRDDGPGNFLTDRLYGYNDYQYDRRELAENPCTWGEERLNTRLARHPDGSLYQLNVKRGLVRVDDGALVMRPDTLEGPAGETVYIGWGSKNRMPPMQDVDFDADGNAYVVPVTIEEEAGSLYTAAAQISLEPSPTVTKLYRSSLQSNGVQEIEVDKNNQVYILDKRDWKNSVLFRFGSLSTTPQQWRLRNLFGIYKPTAMHVSDTDGTVFITSGTSGVALYKIDLEGNSVGDPIRFSDMHYATGITEDPLSNTLWIIGFGFDRYPLEKDLNDAFTFALTQFPYFKPYLAKIPANAPDNITPLGLSEYDTVGEYLALPLSIVATGR